MARWHTLLEYVQFPLKVLFFAIILLGVGNSIINPNVTYLWETKNEVVILIAELMRYSGGFLIRIFPMFVFLIVMVRKFEDSVPVFVGLLTYIVMNLVVLFLENPGEAPYYYGNMLGIQISFEEGSIFDEITRIPYNTGIFSLLLSYYITTRCYLRSRHYTMHGVLSFIDHDAWSMILCIFFGIVSGIVIAFGWPLVISCLKFLYEYLAQDLINPMNLFIYGILERVFAIFGLQEIPREIFWMSELGGSATDNFGVLYNGDVNTWYAMQNLNIATTNAGHLITPYYVINLFLIPGFLTGYFSLTTDWKDRKRYAMFFAIAITLSVLCGNALPMEILMLILSPMLYVLYLLIVGFLYAGFQMLDVAIGYWFQGPIMVANPGSLLDLLPYFRNPDTMGAVSSILTIGCVVFVIFFFATRSYFHHYAIGLFNMSDRVKITNRVIEALGGMNNILSVSSTPDKLTVGLQHRDKVNFDILREEGAYLILESKDGYLIRLGNISTIIAKEIRKQMKKQKALEKKQEKEIS